LWEEHFPHEVLHAAKQLQIYNCKFSISAAGGVVFSSGGRSGILRDSPVGNSGLETVKGNTHMAKPHRKLKKANHGKRPANARARKEKRRELKT
jgi:hypothetical protein